MNRILQVLNFIGILILVGLCTVQWKDNGRLNAQGEDLERTRDEQAAKIADQDKTIKGLNSDLDDVRGKLATSDAALKETQGKLTAALTERDHLTAQRDQLTADVNAYKANQEKWEAAVKERNDRIARDADEIKQDVERVKDAEAKRNDAVNQYNDLVNKYNAVVKQLDDAHKAGYGR